MADWAELSKWAPRIVFGGAIVSRSQEKPGLQSVIELALVSVSFEEYDISYYETLLQTGHGMHEKEAHGLTHADILHAPTFQDVSGDIAAMLNESIFVGWKIKPAARALSEQFAKIGGESNLSESYWDIHENFPAARKIFPDKDHMTAMQQAKAIRSLFNKQYAPDNPEQAVRVRCVSPFPATGIRYTRDEGRVLGEGDETLEEYTETIESVLSDGVIDDRESIFVSELEQNMTEEEIRQGKRAYLNREIDAALSDNVLTAAEENFLESVAAQLGEGHDILDRRLLPFVNCREERRFVEGSTLVLTGIPESELAGMSREFRSRGFNIDPDIRKSATDLLITSTLLSESQKTKKAKKWQIPIMTVEEALIALFPPPAEPSVYVLPGASRNERQRTRFAEKPHLVSHQGYEPVYVYLENKLWAVDSELLVSPAKIVQFTQTEIHLGATLLICPAMQPPITDDMYLAAQSRIPVLPLVEIEKLKDISNPVEVYLPLGEQGEHRQSNSAE